MLRAVLQELREEVSALVRSGYSASCQLIRFEGSMGRLPRLHILSVSSARCGLTLHKMLQVVERDVAK